MINRYLGLSLLPLLALALAMGCSGGAGGAAQNPASPSLAGDTLTQAADSRDRNAHVLWGLYTIAIDPATLEATVDVLRSAEFTANVTQFMQPPVSPTSRIIVFIDSGASDMANGLFAVDITLSHPFPGLSQYSGFDVRGIFMGDGSIVSDHYSSLSWAGDDQARLLNADGWTRWWNPYEFLTYGSIFGYTKGSFSTPGYMADATLNGYKYFCDGLGSEDKMSIDPASRGFFAMTSSNKRRYMIQFPMAGGVPVVKFNYAVDASWEQPSGGGPDHPKGDFSLDANCQEAYQVSMADAGSDAWYEGPGSSGGNLVFDITVYDWQATVNPAGVPGEVAAIWAESAGLLSAPVNVLPSATVSPDGPTSSVFHVEIDGVHPTGLTGQTLLIGVNSKSPADYAPQIDGITGFVYPEEPLAAYMFWDAPILNEEPIVIPVPTGLDSCAAAGVVKLFWSAVSWPTLAGYNIYRKLSSDPDFDFGSPLNPAPVTGTLYYDTDVLKDGTTYDYVVTTVDTSTMESAPSNQTTSTPQYVEPVGFTDLDNPDGIMGSSNVSNYINAVARVDGTIALIWDWGPRFVWGNMDGSYGNTISLGGDGQAPNVDMDSHGNAHVVWTNGYMPGRQYYYAKITPGGAVQNQATIHTFTSGDGWEAESCIVVTPDDEIHIVLVSSDGQYDLIYMHGQPGSFSTPVVLTHDVYQMPYVVRPEMVGDRFGNLHLVWVGSGMSAIRYMKRDTSGVWSTPVDASQGLGNYFAFPDVAVDILGAVHVAWSGATNYLAYYSNNRSGTFQGKSIPGSSASNFVGVACDRHGNAYVDWWNNGVTGAAMFDYNSNILKTAQINDDVPYEGSWCTMAGITDPCYPSNTSVIAFWKEFPNSPPPVYGRLRADY